MIIGNWINTIPDVSREDYHFDGWYTESSGGEQINKYTTVREDVTYYAHWTKDKITITYKDNI